MKGWTNEKLIRKLEKSKWKFAKTFKYRAPHWYTLQETWKSEKEFTEVASEVRIRSRIEYFWGKPFLTWNYQGMKYWVMDKDVKDATLINKTFSHTQFKNRDDILLSETGEKDKEKTRNIITDLFDKMHRHYKFVYEIGCGDTTNYSICNKIDSSLYLGIDPNGDYIRKARELNPNYKFLIDRFETYRRGKFVKNKTMLVSLFGSPNFVIPNFLDEINEYGSYLLMFYKKNECPYDNIYPYYYTEKELYKKLNSYATTTETEKYLIYSYG